MEVLSEIKKDEISGLQIWTAREVKELATVGGLVRHRLGPWHYRIFPTDPFASSEEAGSNISVFCLPSYDYLVKHKKRPTQELPLGTVCWRALLSRYVDEHDFLETTPPKQFDKMFEVRDEVGAFGQNLACYVHTVDIYKIIFSNLEPSDRSKVKLNKAERIMTLIGDFSMLYYSNAKWFHFVPRYNRVPAGAYEEDLELLLKFGRSFDIGKFGLASNPGLIGSWTYDLKEVENGEREFSLAVEKDMQAVVDAFRVHSDNEGTKNGMSRKIRSGNVFFGGVSTKEKEYEVSRVLANVIPNVVWVVGSGIY